MVGDTSNKTGAEFIAIPHNSNISKGYMFDRTTLEGDQITASYAKTRLAWEPIVEVTQIKGDSETHSKLSPNDDFADFENYEYHIQVGKSKYIPQEADFVRPALKVGLEIEKSVGVNPYKFGLIGSTDSHSGLSSPEESNFLGKFATDSTPETKKRLGSRLSANGWDMSVRDWRLYGLKIIREMRFLVRLNVVKCMRLRVQESKYKYLPVGFFRRAQRMLIIFPKLVINMVYQWEES